MKELDHLTLVHLDMVLEDVCRSLPHGGDHMTRKKVAQKLLSRARKAMYPSTTSCPSHKMHCARRRRIRERRELTARRGRD